MSISGWREPLCSWLGVFQVWGDDMRWIAGRAPKRLEMMRFSPKAGYRAASHGFITFTSRNGLHSSDKRLLSASLFLLRSCCWWQHCFWSKRKIIITAEMIAFPNNSHATANACSCKLTRGGPVLMLKSQFNKSIKWTYMSSARYCAWFAMHLSDKYSSNDCIFTREKEKFANRFSYQIVYCQCRMFVSR